MNDKKTLRASELAKVLGESLVGRRVKTIQMGEYPGGIAVVTEIAPDPNAPEIAFNVKLPGYDVIGVFDYEPVELVTR